MFDEQAFFSHGAHVFFDEDGRQLFFNLDTDLLQGEEGQKEFPGARVVSVSRPISTDLFLP